MRQLKLFLLAFLLAVPIINAELDILTELQTKILPSSEMIPNDKICQPAEDIVNSFSDCAWGNPDWIGYAWVTRFLFIMLLFMVYMYITDRLSPIYIIPLILLIIGINTSDSNPKQQIFYLNQTESHQSFFQNVSSIPFNNVLIIMLIIILVYLVWNKRKHNVRY